MPQPPRRWRVLAGSGAYALSEVMDWKSGLVRKAAEAPGFYGIVAVPAGLRRSLGTYAYLRHWHLAPDVA
jgi:hypothetical protein